MADEKWGYRDKVILAPMVRVGTLPMRLLAREYGADMCYCEELIDKKIITCKRVVNSKLSTVDFAPENVQHPVFRTVPGERVVFQMGTANAALALKAAHVIAGDVRAIDINMGCPKRFSIHAGMGAALLTKPETVKDIISTLSRNLPLPITAKIRLLPDIKDTINLVRVIEQAGAKAVAVHVRHQVDRPAHQGLYDKLPLIVEHATVPVIHNGDAFYHEDIARLKELTKADSIMIARGAQWNPSIFGCGKGTMLPVYDVARRYIELADKYDNLWGNTKYVLTQMVMPHSHKSSHWQRFQRHKGYDGIRKVLDDLANCERAPGLRGPYQAPAPTWMPRPDPNLPPDQIKLSKAERRKLRREKKRERKREARKARRAAEAARTGTQGGQATADTATNGAGSEAETAAAGRTHTLDRPQVGANKRQKS